MHLDLSHTIASASSVQVRGGAFERAEHEVASSLLFLTHSANPSNTQGPTFAEYQGAAAYDYHQYPAADHAMPQAPCNDSAYFGHDSPTCHDDSGQQRAHGHAVHVGALDQGSFPHMRSGNNSVGFASRPSTSSHASPLTPLLRPLGAPYTTWRAPLQPVQESGHEDDDMDQDADGDDIFFDAEPGHPPSNNFVVPALPTTLVDPRAMVLEDTIDESFKNKNACAFCGKMCGKPSLREEHERVHTDERLFVCDARACGKAFKTPSNKKRHHTTCKHHKGMIAIPTSACGKISKKKLPAAAAPLGKNMTSTSAASAGKAQVDGKSGRKRSQRLMELTTHSKVVGAGHTTRDKEMAVEDKSIAGAEALIAGSAFKAVDKISATGHVKAASSSSVEVATSKRAMGTTSVEDDAHVRGTQATTATKRSSARIAARKANTFGIQEHSAVEQSASFSTTSIGHAQQHGHGNQAASAAQTSREKQTSSTQNAPPEGSNSNVPQFPLRGKGGRFVSNRVAAAGSSRSANGEHGENKSNHGGSLAGMVVDHKMGGEQLNESAKTGNDAAGRHSRKRGRDECEPSQEDTDIDTKSKRARVGESDDGPAKRTRSKGRAAGHRGPAASRRFANTVDPFHSQVGAAKESAVVVAAVSEKPAQVSLSPSSSSSLHAVAAIAVGYPQPLNHFPQDIIDQPVVQQEWLVSSPTAHTLAILLCDIKNTTQEQPPAAAQDADAWPRSWVDVPNHCAGRPAPVAESPCEQGEMGAAEMAPKTRMMASILFDMSQSHSP